MPAIYGGQRWLNYWYVPAGIVLALGMAIGVVFAADKLFGNDGGAGNDNEVLPTIAIGTPPPTTAPSPTQGPTAAGPTAVANGKFKAGDTAVVTGTAPDCLNVRPNPVRSNEAITCLQDTESVSITAGPQTGDGFTWWKVKSNSGEGWAVEDYLKKQ
jgi:hypothetical protein